MRNIRDNHIAEKLLALMVCLFLTQITAGRIIYVDASVAEPNDGTSWNDAYKHLQDAMAVVRYGDEIRVADGIYTPDSNSAVPDGTGDREATFELVNGVALRGGYAGFGATEPNTRNFRLYKTVLSGDLDGDDIDVDDPCDLLTEPKRADNAYHVVTGSGTDENTILDGFVIIAGNANGSNPFHRGGGMYNESGRATLQDCIFTLNSAEHGAGMHNRHSNPKAVNCMFRRNSASKTGSGMYNLASSPTVIYCTFSHNSTLGDNGGGMYNVSDSSPIIVNCVFSNNSAGQSGGGMYNDDSDPIVTGCTFSNNSAYTGVGGGIDNEYYSDPIVANCLFRDNWAWQSGGGMYSLQYSRPNVSNCIFSGNSASWWGGGMCNDRNSAKVSSCTFTGNSAKSGGGGGGIANLKTTVAMANCVFWGNTAYDCPQIAVRESTVSLNHCNIQGGLGLIHITDSNSSIDWGPGNIDVNPALTPDGHLRALGRKGAQTQHAIIAK